VTSGTGTCGSPRRPSARPARPHADAINTATATRNLAHPLALPYLPLASASLSLPGSHHHALRAGRQWLPYVPTSTAPKKLPQDQTAALPAVSGHHASRRSPDVGVGLKTVGNSRENHNHSCSCFFCRERERKRDRRTGKRKRYYGISGTEYIGREYIGYDREAVTQIGNNTCNHSKRLTRHNSYNHTSFTCKIY